MQMFQSNLSAMTWNDVNFFAQLQITVINASLRQRLGCMEVMKIMHICKIKYAHNILCSLLSTLENWKYYVLLVLELTIWTHKISVGQASMKYTPAAWPRNSCTPYRQSPTIVQTAPVAWLWNSCTDSRKNTRSSSRLASNALSKSSKILSEFLTVSAGWVYITYERSTLFSIGNDCTLLLN